MQVKLWQLLAAFLCITVSIGYWAIQRRNYLVEQKGIQQIEEAGGYVADYMCFDHGVFSEYKVDGAGQYRGLRYARVTGIIVERFQDSYGSGELHKDAIMVATQRLAKGIQRLPETKFIRISDPRFGDRHLDQLSSIPSLEFLDLSGCSVGDAGLESLSRFPMLRALSLRGTKVYSDFQSFGKLERLKKLDLSGTRVNHFGLDSLTEATELHELLLSSTDTTDGDLATLAKLHRLRLLDLSDTPVTGKGLSFLTGLSNLQSLTLSGDLDFSFLCNLRVTKLEIVDLFEKNPTLFGIKSIVGLSDLELEGSAISDSLLEIVGRLALRSLKLSGCTLTEPGASSISGMGRLRCLHLSDVLLEENELRIICNSNSLDTVTLEGIPNAEKLEAEISSSAARVVSFNVKR